jgi:hypothetical protein
VSIVASHVEVELEVVFELLGICKRAISSVWGGERERKGSRAYQFSHTLLGLGLAHDVDAKRREMVFKLRVHLGIVTAVAVDI